MGMENTVQTTISSQTAWGPFDVTNINAVALQWFTTSPQVSTPLTANVTYQVSTDGVNWNTAPWVSNLGVTGYGPPSETLTGAATSAFRIINLNGATHFRINVSSYVSGSIYFNLNLNGQSSNTFVVPFSPTKVTPAGTQGTVNFVDRKSTRLNSSHIPLSRMPSSA